MNNASKGAPAPSGSTGGGESASSSALGAAKWLIPSVTGLFAVTGYIVRSAHTGLIGREVDFASAPGYAGAAADFLRDLPTVAFDALLNADGSVPLAGHGLALLVAALLVSAALVLPRCLRADTRAGAVAAGLPVGVLALLLAWKFLLLDAPLSRLEGLVIGTGPAAIQDGPTPWASDPQVEQPGDGLQVLRPQRTLQRIISDRAECLYRSVATTRLQQDAGVEGRPALPIHRGLDCPADAATGTDLQGAEFLARLIACLLTGALAAVVVRQRPPAVSAVGLLGLASLLTLPYAYGKLLVPSYFEVGRVVLAPALVAAPGLDGPARKSGAIDAIVLSRRGSGLELLVLASGACPLVDTAVPTAAPVRDTYRVARLWTIPTSQILSVREIHREDVLAWKLRNEFGCTTAAPAPGKQPLQRNR
jgi:hypothetical protein